jgi:HAD superfamily hydrolase (TIGR01493 family)
VATDRRRQTVRATTVFFDNGGTLCHRVSAAPVIRRLAAEVGRPIDLELAEELWEAIESSEAPLELRRARNLSAEAHRSAYESTYEPLAAVHPALPRLFYDHYKASPETLIPYPDATGVLATLHAADRRIGVVSNTGWNIRTGFVHNGLARFVDDYVLSFEWKAAKPDRRLFEIACERLEADPDECVMVGNDARADGGAAEIGIPVLVLPEARPGEPRGLALVLGLLGLPAGEDAADRRTEASPVPAGVGDRHLEDGR